VPQEALLARLGFSDQVGQRVGRHVGARRVG
jgi:hypothetical protein